MTVQSNTQVSSEARPAQEHHVASRSRRAVLVSLWERFGLLVIWAIVVAVFSGLKPDTYFTQANLASILGSQAVLVVLALGLLITLTAGDFDVTVAFVCGLSAMIIAVLNVNHGWAIGWAILVALLAGFVVGCVNGLLVVIGGIDSLIATLGMGTVLSGVIVWISNSNTISGVSPQLVQWVIGNRFLNIPLEFYYGLGLCVALWYVLHFSLIGRHLAVVGRERRVARLSGMPVRRLRFGAYIVSGLVAAGAGVMYAGTIGAADPTSFSAFFLPSFAAVFLGATAITPGQFNPWGTVIAVYFLVSGITGLEFLGVESFVHDIFYGSALIIAVLLSQIARRREHRQAEGVE